MFTVQDLIDRIRFLIAEDSTNTFFSNADIIKAININVDKMYDDLELPNASITLNTVAGTREYNLPADVVNVYDVWFENNDLRYRVKKIEFDDMLDEHDDSYASNIIDCHYIKQAVVSDEYILQIGFYPMPDSVIVMHLEVQKASPTLTLVTDKVPLGKKHLAILTDLILYDLFTRDAIYDRANFHLNRYDTEIYQEKTKSKGISPEYVD